tara:strand:- start:1752 stop:2333 length:582 start_codon:yes stop_codon:yes gene_type:complete
MSTLRTQKVTPLDGETNLILGDSGDTIALAAGATATGFGGGKILQVVNVQDGAVATTTSQTPLHDDTKPLISEGTEFLTLAVTGASTNNYFYVECKIWLGHTVTNRNIITALWNTDVHATEAIATCGIQNHTATATSMYPWSWYGAVPTTNATTFRVRAGSQGSGTTTYTGQDGGRKHGGAMLSSITIWEISA